MEEPTKAVDRLSHAYHREFPVAFATGPTSFDADYLLFASSGTFILEVLDRQWLLPPQRAALIPRGTEISVRSRGSATSSSVLFAEGEVHALKEMRVFAMSELARQMTARAMRWGDSSSPDDVKARFYRALADVVVELSLEQQNSWLPRARSRNVQAAIDYAIAHLDRDVPLSELAQVAVLSERTLSRRFKDELGLGWADFRNRARMIGAMDLLADKATQVTEVAFTVGFDSTSSFIRAFQRFTGQTPNSYRRTLTGRV